MQSNTPLAVTIRLKLDIDFPRHDAGPLELLGDSPMLKTTMSFRCSTLGSTSAISRNLGPFMKREKQMRVLCSKSWHQAWYCRGHGGNQRTVHHMHHSIVMGLSTNHGLPHNRLD